MNELLSNGMQLFKDRNIVPGKKNKTYQWIFSKEDEKNMEFE